MCLTEGEYLKKVHFTLFQLIKIIYLLNLQCNVPPTRGPSAIAKPLVNLSAK